MGKKYRKHDPGVTGVYGKYPEQIQKPKDKGFRNIRLKEPGLTESDKDSIKEEIARKNRGRKRENAGQMIIVGEKRSNTRTGTYKTSYSEKSRPNRSAPAANRKSRKTQETSVKRCNRCVYLHVGKRICNNRESTRYGRPVRGDESCYYFERYYPDR